MEEAPSCHSLVVVVALSLESHTVAVSQVTVTEHIVVADTVAYVVVQTVVMAAASQAAC